MPGTWCAAARSPWGQLERCPGEAARSRTAPHGHCWDSHRKPERSWGSPQTPPRTSSQDPSGPVPWPQSKLPLLTHLPALPQCYRSTNRPLPLASYTSQSVNRMFPTSTSREQKGIKKQAWQPKPPPARCLSYLRPMVAGHGRRPCGSSPLTKGAGTWARTPHPNVKAKGSPKQS